MTDIDRMVAEAREIERFKSDNANSEATMGSPTKVGSNVRQMADTFAPPLGLLCKIGSILVHVEEGAGDGGHRYDWAAVRSLLADREVQDWLDSMRAKALVPVKRR